MSLLGSKSYFVFCVSVILVNLKNVELMVPEEWESSGSSNPGTPNQPLMIPPAARTDPEGYVKYAYGDLDPCNSALYPTTRNERCELYVRILWTVPKKRRIPQCRYKYKSTYCSSSASPDHSQCRVKTYRWILCFPFNLGEYSLQDCFLFK